MDLDARRAFAGNKHLAHDERQRLFDSLWREWYPRLAAYLRSYASLSPEDREELAGDALLRAYERADRYKPELPFEPWLVAIARRLALSRLRAANRSREFPTAPEDLRDAADTRHRGPEGECVREAERVEVAAFVHSLPERERELAFLVFGRDMSLADAARATGAPLGTVKWRMSRLRARMRETLEVQDA